MGLYRPVRAVLDPLVAATYPVPKSAIVPLLLLIFGLGEMSKIVMVAIGAFFPVVINTSAGVHEIPPHLPRRRAQLQRLAAGRPSAPSRCPERCR